MKNTPSIFGIIFLGAIALFLILSGLYGGKEDPLSHHEIFVGIAATLWTIVLVKQRRNHKIAKSKIVLN